MTNIEEIVENFMLCHHCVAPKSSKTHKELLDCKTDNKKIALMPQTHAQTQDKQTIHIFTLPESTHFPSLTGLTTSAFLWDYGCTARGQAPGTV